MFASWITNVPHYDEVNWFYLLLSHLSVQFRSPHDLFVLSFVPSFVRSFLRLASVRFWPAFTLTVHSNALYNESVHGREEHATWINSIPLKIATLLNLQSLKWALILSGPMCSLYPLRVATIRFSGTGRFGHDHFGTECRSKRQFGSQIRYSWLRL